MDQHEIAAEDQGENGITESRLSVIEQSPFVATTSSAEIRSAAASHYHAVSSGHGSSSSEYNTRHRSVSVSSETAARTASHEDNAALQQQLDFIGVSPVVKNLFSLPYSSGKPLSIAIHNLDGTLLVDDASSIMLPKPSSSSDAERHASTSRHLGDDDSEDGSSSTSTDNDGSEDDGSSEVSNPLSEDLEHSLALALTTNITTDKQTEALSMLNQIMVRARNEHQKQHRHRGRKNLLTLGSSPNLLDKNSWTLSEAPVLPKGEATATPIPPNPREYVQWQFRDMNLLVGSDALIVRSPSSPTSSTSSASFPYSADDQTSAEPGSATTTALAIRVEDVNDMRTLLDRHQQMVQQKLYIPDHQAPLMAQRGKPSYAQALAQNQAKSGFNNDQQQTNRRVPSRNENNDSDSDSDDEEKSNRQIESFSAPNLDLVQLQTCIVPSSGPLGGLLQDANPQFYSSSDNHETSLPGLSDASTPSSPSASPQTSPVSIVLDAYLDNLMANVPQLALCLQEKGFIQSIKLMQTTDIPAMLMNPSTLDTSTYPISNVGRQSTQHKKNGTAASSTDEIFSPQIMEMNASALLRFLKANCTKNNATYLLSRDSGQTNIQLYDISSISTQRQKKWVWWLATMSYRFALRLRHLETTLCSSTSTASSSSPQFEPQFMKSRRRSFRDRQRSLFQTTLDLLDDLKDMDGRAHESLVAAVNEHMADTFLSGEEDINEPANGSTFKSGETKDNEVPSTSMPRPVMSFSEEEKRRRTSAQTQPYAHVTIDALNKSQDYLVKAIKILWPVLEKAILQGKKREERRKQRKLKRTRQHQETGVAVVSVSNDDDDEDQDDSDAEVLETNEAVIMQLFGLHYKLINVSLRLAEHHLRNYFSSSAMQALRLAARRIADSASLVVALQRDPDIDILKSQMYQSLQIQYCWLWEHCGHFARSFASDELWRDRGHACGDDVIYVLRDAESAFQDQSSILFQNPKFPVGQIFAEAEFSLAKRSHDSITFTSLSGIVDVEFQLGKTKKVVRDGYKSIGIESMEAAATVLAGQRLLDRDKRKVLVAACIAYDRAIHVFEAMLKAERREKIIEDTTAPLAEESKEKKEPSILNLLRQRMGDACNETGKMLLASLRHLLKSSSPSGLDADKVPLAAAALLSSAQFWFLEGLVAFEICKDIRNLALLRCNLCQCYKLRANSSFANQQFSDGTSHAESCLQEAADHLQAAHETMGVRDVDPMTWDMVSGELAATFLVLAVRRRQSLLGGGNTPVILQAMRLSPGKERSIFEPMEKALEIYEQSGIRQQAAAVHYQLALTNSKLWTCQRDESKTREKLSAAFQNYNMAFAYYSSSLRGNEPTFVLLCLDLASLYSAVSGEEDCVAKALGCCLESHRAFAPDILEGMRPLPQFQQWLDKMKTLASSVEELVMKLIRSLVKLEEASAKNAGKDKSQESYKNLYRKALTAKVKPEISNQNEATMPLSKVHYILVTIHENFRPLTNRK